jgi:hypothetical protein
MMKVKEKGKTWAKPVFYFVTRETAEITKEGLPTW